MSSVLIEVRIRASRRRRHGVVVHALPIAGGERVSCDCLHAARRA
jgi:hypothetical protein